MTIDRIGKPGGLGPASSIVPTPGAAANFEVARPESAVAAAPSAVVASSSLAQLRSGQLDLEGYLGAKLDKATAHLHGLAPEQLEAIRGALRDQLATDPALADLVTQATGQVAGLPQD